MSKQSYVLGLQPEVDGPIFGRVDDPVQLQNAQKYGHQHIEKITQDLLVAGAAAAQVTGFAATLPGGLGVAIAAGHVVDDAGISYLLEDAVTVNVNAADPANPRIDLVYATLAADVEAESELTLVRQLRTLDELDAAREPYVPTQYNVPTELQNLATIHVRAGNPAGVPVAPAAGAGEVPLWQVHVAAAQTVLGGGDLTDVRNLMKSLWQALTSIAALQTLVTQAGLTEIVQDIVGAFLTAGTGIQLTYNDAGNVETVAIQTEGLQDLVGAFISAANASIVVVYNDAGNIETIALNPAYVTLLDGATALATADTIVKRDVGGGVIHAFPIIQHGEGSSGAVSGKKALLYLNNDVTLYNANPVAIIAFAGRTGGTTDHATFGYIVYGKENATADNIAGFLGMFVANAAGSYVEAIHAASTGNITMPANLSVVGNLSKGSGTFLIDHPLDPNNKDLRHGFVESPRFDLIYRGEVVLVAGEAAVDIDAASGMTAGTFAALTQNPQVFLQNKNGWAKVRVQAASLIGAAFTIEADDAEATDTVGWLVIAERKDDYIKAIDQTDEDGHLVVEYNKPAPDAALLDAQTRTDMQDEAAPDEVVEEVVTALLGTQGYPWHASIVGEGDVPTRTVTLHIHDLDDNPYDPGP